MEPKYISLESLFNSSDTGSFFKKRIQVPPFQRPYSWIKNNWETLWEDMTNDDTDDYFLGSIVTIKQDDCFEAVDGQQRITTISLFCLAIRNFLKAVKTPELESKQDELGNLRTSIHNICTIDEQPRLTLSKQSKTSKATDEDNYKNLCKTIINSHTFYRYDKNQSKEIDVYGKSLIANCFIFFEDKIFKLLECDNTIEDNRFIDTESTQYQELIKLINKIKNAKIVHFSTDNSATAFKLFDCLNNRGVPLTVSEILKNKFFEGIEIESKVKKYDFKDIDEKWTEMAEEWFDNDNKLQTRFLRHFLISEMSLGKNIGIKDVKKITASRVIEQLLSLQKNDFNLRWKDFLNYFLEAAKTYKNLCNIFYINKEYYKDDTLEVAKVAHIGYSVIHLLIYHLLRLGYGKKFINDVSHLMWRFSLRVQISGAVENKYVDNAIVSTVQNIKENKSDLRPIDVFKLFFDNLKIKNRDFIILNNIEKLIVSEDTYEASDDLARNILFALELNFQKIGERTEILKHKDNKTNEYFFTIEHILPQQPKTNCLWNEWFTENQKKKYKHKLGNLTLTAYNAKLATKEFDGKLEILKNSSFKINADIIKKEEWKPKQIDNRTEKLAQELIDILYIDLIDKDEHGDLKKIA